MVCAGCQRGDNLMNEIFIKSYDNNIVDFRDSIVNIFTDTYYSTADMYILEDYLIVTAESMSTERVLDIYNKNTFEFLAGAGTRGRGPGEVTRPGRLAIEHENKVIWVSDHGKRLLWKFPLDSILNNPFFMPSESLEYYPELFLERFGFINNTIALGKAVRVLDNNRFEMVTAKLNVQDNSTWAFGYEHPQATQRLSNSLFNLSLNNQMYVNAYVYLDLITFCNMDGSLILNIYGPEFKKYKDGQRTYYSGVDFLGEFIIASYVGDDRIIYNSAGRPMGNSPSKFVVFNTKGKYIKTMEMGCQFSNFTIDEQNQRVIVYFNDRENPLGYYHLNLSE